ncbi:MAG: sugar phosphate isomerase/epimerase [Chloroflexi bacterium]|nr:MAG: sugar phosphate isomerase/epimerase [Chloroflexota bacterium]
MTAIHLNGATLMTTPTQRVLEIAREVGYAGIEARAERLLADVSEVHATARIARPEEVLALNGVALTLHRDGRVNRDVLDEDLAPRIRICKEIGSPFLLAIPPRAPGVKTRPAMVGTREALKHAREHAAAVDVRIAFEFLGFADCPINTPALAAETVDGIDGIELVIDATHWHASGSPPLGDFPIDRLALVHLNDVPAKPLGEIEDGERVFPGEGVIMLGELVAQLKAGGYTGPWSLETFNPSYWADDPETVARRGFGAVVRVLEERSRA